MNVPKSFKKAIKATFYDKELTRHDVSENISPDGFARESEPNDTPNLTFLANVQFENLDQVKEDYGLREDINATITTDADIANGDILQYESKFYKVVKAISRDSHNFIMVIEWSSQSRTSIRA